MISYCDGCGASYRDDNLMDCENGGAYCYRCYGERCRNKKEAMAPAPVTVAPEEQEETYQALLQCINDHVTQGLWATPVVVSLRHEFDEQNKMRAVIEIHKEAMSEFGAWSRRHSHHNPPCLILPGFCFLGYGDRALSRTDCQVIGNIGKQIGALVEAYIRVGISINRPISYRISL